MEVSSERMRMMRSGAMSAEEEELGFSPFLLMEELIEKLKILNYEDEFIKTLKMRPLSRHYFAVNSNSGEQFFMFTALCGWLLEKLSIAFQQPQEYDDPNSTIATILEALRNLGITVDFSPGKLKKGSGWYTLNTLNNLTDKVFQRNGITYKKATPPVESEDVYEVIDDEIELMLDRIEEEMAAEESDIDEDNILNLDDLYVATAYMDSSKPDDILESNTTLEEWNLELERVLPMLKVSVKSNVGDWRSHLESMKHHRASLEQIVDSVSSHLTKLSSDIDLTMQKIAKREKLINSQLQHLLEQYRGLRDELAVVNEQYKEVNGGVVERQQVLNNISETLESVKQEMEERGTTMSDGSPLVQIKKAIKDIKKEIYDMDINIAVAEHILVEAKVREKSSESPSIRSSGTM